MKNRFKQFKIKDKDIQDARLNSKKIASILGQFQYRGDESINSYRLYTIHRGLKNVVGQMKGSRAFSYDCFIQDHYCDACRLAARSMFLLSSMSKSNSPSYYSRYEQQQEYQEQDQYYNQRNDQAQISSSPNLPSIIQFNNEFKIKQLFGQDIVDQDDNRFKSNTNDPVFVQAKFMLISAFSCMCKVQSIINTGCEQGFIQFPQFQTQLQLQLFEKDDNKKRRKIQAIRNKASASYAEFKAHKQVTLDI